MFPRMGALVGAAVTLVVVAALLPVAVDARVELLPEPIGCRISTLWINDGSHHLAMCEKLYRGVSASDVNTAYPAGRTTPFLLSQSEPHVRFLYETPQSFNTVCFQQPPSITQWAPQTFQALIGHLEVWAVPADAVPGDVNAPLVAPDFTVYLSLGSELRCYPLPQAATAQRVIVRLVPSAASQGSPAASTLVLARDTAWEPSLPAQAVSRPGPADESMPVDVADVVAIHGVDGCSATSRSPSLTCRGAFDTTPSPSDVNTAYAAGRGSVWSPSPATQAPMSMTLPSVSVVNGLCAQQTASGYTSVERTGRIDVWNGRVADVNAASTPAPAATVVFPQSSGGELMCYRLLDSNGAEVSFTTADITFRVWKAVDGYYTHGLATLLPAQLTPPPGAEPVPVPPAQLTFFTPRSCTIDFTIDYTIGNNGDNGPPCTALYNSAVSASDVGTTYSAGAKRNDQWVRVNNGVVRFLLGGTKPINTVCLKQPSAMTGLWGPTVQPIVASLEIWPGSIPAAASWTEPAAAPHTVAVSAESKLLCYALPAVMTTRNVTVRISVTAASQGTPGASSLFFAYDPAWTAPSSAQPVAITAGVRTDRGLQRETLPVPTSMVRTIHRAVGCDVSASWPDGRASCIYAYNNIPTPSDVNTPFTPGNTAGSWTTFLQAGGPLTITLGASSFVNAVCYQQRNAAFPPGNVDMASMIEVWPGRVTGSAMLSTPPRATVVLPRSAGRELFCYPLVDAATGAAVNFTTADVSFRVWRAQGLNGAQGAGTLLPATVGAEGLVIATPTPTSLSTPPPTVAPPTDAPAPTSPFPEPTVPPDTSSSPTPGPRSSNANANDDDGAAVSTVAIIAIVAVAVVTIIIVITIGVVCAIRQSSRTSQQDTPPPQLAVPTPQPVPVEGRPLDKVAVHNVQPEHVDVEPVHDDASPYPPPGHYGYANNVHTPDSQDSERSEHAALKKV